MQLSQPVARCRRARSPNPKPNSIPTETTPEKTPVLGFGPPSPPAVSFVLTMAKGSSAIATCFRILGLRFQLSICHAEGQFTPAYYHRVTAALTT